MVLAWLVLACAVCRTVSGELPIGSTARPHVLILNSYHPGYVWSDNEQVGVVRTLETGHPGLGPYIEYLDAKRFPGPEHAERLFNLLQAKYVGIKLDLVMTLDNPALDFALRHQGVLFPDAAVAFCGVDGFTQDMIAGHTRVTGVMEAVDVEGTLEMALRLQPQAVRLVFIHDQTEGGLANRRLAEAAARRLAPRLTVQFLDHWTAAELVEAVKQIPAGSIVVKLGLTRDRAGVVVADDVEFRRTVRDACRGPLYFVGEPPDATAGVAGSLDKAWLALGGSLLSGEDQGVAAARMGLRILAGERAENLPVLARTPGRPMVDYLLMQQWALPLEALPPGTAIVHRPVSFFDQHKAAIIPTLAIIGVLVATILGLIGNILGRRRAEAALRASHERFELLAKVTNDAVWDWNMITKRSWWNQRMCDLFGSESAGQELSYEAWVARIHPEDRERVLGMFQHLVEGQATEWATEYRCLRADGSTAFLLDRGLIQRGAFGQPVRMVGTMFDITDRKQAELDRMEMNRKLLETQKLESLGLLAGGVAHDFNNLLTAILGNATLARMDLASNSTAQEYLEQIEKTSLRAAELCKQMLAYSGRGRFVVQRLDLSAVVREMAKLLELSVGKKAALRYNLAPELPAVLADATQLRQIVMNLVINASEAIGDQSGTITLSTGVMEADRAYLHETHLSPDIPEGRYVFFEVSDTGCGMSPETQARIFDPFFTTKFTGRGLGLAAVQGIARGHGGALKVYSEEGRGSTFKLLLPCTQGLPHEADAAPVVPPVWRGHGTVLVVDDEQAVRLVAERMLRSFGFDVATASDGREGIEVFHGEPDRWTLVLLDLTMPRMDGEEMFREIRRVRPEARVLLMSGFNEQEAISRFVGKGLAGFIQKPFRRETLEEKLREICPV